MPAVAAPADKRFRRAPVKPAKKRGSSFAHARLAVPIVAVFALMSSPWVEDATLRRMLPATVEIVVRERRPIGIGRIANGLYLVDARGVIVDEYGPNYADFDLPIIDGLASAPRDGAPAVDEAKALLAARLILALQARPDLAAKVSQIDVSDAHDAVVILDGDTAMLRLGEDDFVERLQEYVDLRPALRERVAGVGYVD